MRMKYILFVIIIMLFAVTFKCGYDYAKKHKHVTKTAYIIDKKILHNVWYNEPMYIIEYSFSKDNIGSNTLNVIKDYYDCVEIGDTIKILL